MSIPEAAIEAAAEALHDAGWTCISHEPRDSYQDCDVCADITPKAARQILTAALPAIREQIAGEVESLVWARSEVKDYLRDGGDLLFVGGMNSAIANAARLIREGGGQ